jgi:F-type H+-transporting ATPase subunit a
MTQTTENKNFNLQIIGIIQGLLLLVLSLFGSYSVASSDIEEELEHKPATEDKSFDAGSMIMHHIADAHNIHFFTLHEAEENEKHYTINLPMILWTDNGFDLFSSSHFYHNPIHVDHGHAYEHKNYILADEIVYYKGESGGLTYDESGAISNATPLDLSITKTVTGLLLTTFIILIVFLTVARSYKKRPNQSPKGLQSLIEPLVIFVRDDIVRPSIGKKADTFMPFLMTVFFFIWIANLLGLMSFLGGYNVMGSISVTMVLAFLVFAITTFHGNKAYWKHIVWPDNIPFLIKLLLVPIEVLQVFMKPLVLMIRLTANITAGHIIILAFTALIFIFGQDSVMTGYSVGVGSLLFMVFMFFIELLVAFLQAYVFTLLAAIYFGSAVEEAHH